MPDVGGALTRKIGPLPAWGWGVAVGGAALGVKMLRGGSGGGGVNKQVIEVPTGAPYPSPDFASDLGTRLDELSNRIDDLAQQSNDNTSKETIPGPTNKPPDNNQPNPVYTIPKGEVPSKITTPKPVTKATRITQAQGESILKKLGAPTTWARSAFAKAASSAYIWATPEAFKAWALRYARDPKSGYKPVDGKIVKR